LLEFVKEKKIMNYIYHLGTHLFDSVKTKSLSFNSPGTLTSVGTAGGVDGDFDSDIFNSPTIVGNDRCGIYIIQGKAGQDITSGLTFQCNFPSTKSSSPIVLISSINSNNTIGTYQDYNLQIRDVFTTHFIVEFLNPIQEIVEGYVIPQELLISFSYLIIDQS